MPRKTLFFVRGMPTEEQRRQAAALGAVFRNPDLVGRGGEYLESCDFVCGDIIPKQYEDKPRAATSSPSELSPPKEDADDGQPPDEMNAAPSIDLGSMTVAELRNLAKGKSISIPAGVNAKAEIVAYLTEKLSGDNAGQ